MKKIRKQTITNKTILIPLLLLSLALLFSVSTVSAASGDIIYVNASSGNDAWNGLNSTWISGTNGPKATITNATGIVNSGGTVYIANGTYNENNISITKNMNIVGESQKNTIVNGGNAGTIFYIKPGVNVTIMNITLTNGKTTGNGGAIQGGTTQPDSINYNGGAINNQGTLTITNCTFTYNSASNNGAGGAIYNDGTLTAGNCTFAGNGATMGGAIYNLITATVNNGTFTGNSVYSGGAIYNLGTCTVNSSTFTGNSAPSNSGGAIYNNAGTLTVHFSRIVGNSAAISGNNIYRSGGTVDANYNWWGSNSGPSGISGTVTANTWIILTVTASSTTVNSGETSTITADLNHVNGGGVLTGGSIPDGLPVTFSSTLGSISPVNAVTNNGQATATFTSTAYSGIAAGSATVDGVKVNAPITIYNAEIYVSTTGNDTTGDGSAGNPYQTISKGVTCVSPGGKVHIADGTYTGANNTGITISKNMAVIGQSQRGTIINGTNTAQIFTILSDVTVTISNLTLTNGTTTAYGGAIYNGGTLIVADCTFTGNTATGSYGGGAICNFGTATVNIANSTLCNNTATGAYSGGAIYNDGFVGTATVNIVNSTICNNTATGFRNGGAIYNIGYYGTATVNIVNSTICNNTATGFMSAGAIENYYGTAKIYFSRIVGNAGEYTMVNDYGTTFDADYNWWGSNNPLWSNLISGFARNPSSWVILTVTANPTTINNGGTSTITADFNHINGGGLLIGGHIPEGPITLDIPWGSFAGSGTTHSITEDTVNGAINPVTFYANEGAAPSDPVEVTASADGYTTNSVESVYITINKVANISITKTSPATVIAGNQLTYTITITNSGLDPAESVTLIDIVPLKSGTLQYRFKVNDSTWSNWFSFTNPLILSLGAIENGNTAIIEIIGTVDPSTPKGTVITNAATAASTTPETTTTDNSATAKTTVDTQANLVVSKTGPTTVTAGNQLTYTITVTNTGPSDAQNVVIQDTIPAILQNVNHDSFNLGTIGAGQSKTVTITGTVPANIAFGTIIENSATVTSDTSGTITPSGTVQTTVDTQSTLTVDKTGLSTVTAGGTYTGLYTIKVTNNGPSDAQNVVLSDILLFNIVSGSYTVNGGSPVPFSGNSLIVNLGTLTPGTTITIVINGEVASSTPAGSVTNTANAHTDTCSSHDFTSNQFGTTVNTQSVLNVVKESLVSQVIAGVAYTDPIYRITVTNNGPSDARDVQVTDSIPSQIVDREYRINGGAWTSFTGDLNQLISYIANGDSSMIEIRGSIPSSIPAGSMSNMASASVYGTTFDSNTVNTTIITSADVNLNEAVDKSRPNVGDTVTFTITVRNNGPSDAINIRIGDLMPSDFANVTVIGSKGTYTGGVWTLDLASGEEATLALSGKVTAIMAGKNTTNTALLQGSTDSANATIYVPKSDLYIQITSDKSNPKVGEMFTLTYKLGNKGLDEATNVTITIPLPECFELANISGDGNWTYNANNNTITWTLTNVPVGDPYLYISGKVLSPGSYVFGSSMSSKTYNINSQGVTPVTINAVSQVNVASTTKTIPLQHTGLPFAGLVLAILAVLGGLVAPKRK